MSVPLKLLIIEDSKDDTELLIHALQRAGYKAAYTRVESAAQLQHALSEQWDLIISDYVLPQFSGLAALAMTQQTGHDVPFIIVSGKIGEETAVEALKAGAHDYLLKDRLTRLGPAIDRELREAALRRRKKQADLALRESEERYRRLVESSPEATFICCDGKFVYVNPAAVQLFGAQSPLDLVGKSFLEFIDPNYRDLVTEHLRQTMSGTDGPLLEERILRLDGTILTVEAIARAITYHGENAAQIICRDVTSRKRLEEQLQHTQRMESIGRFAGGVANDFNNLLTVIVGYAGLIKSALPPGDKLVTDVGQITSSAERAFSLTQQLMALSRKQTILLAPMDLNGLVAQSRSLLARLLGEKVQLLTYLGPELGSVNADASQMENVLIHLTVRARNAMPEGGKLVLETHNVTLPPEKAAMIGNLAAGDYVALSMTDSGYGLTDEARLHVFEPFYDHTEVGPGTGLGLATVYAMVRQHGGHISCSSEMGRGSTFRIYLPRIETPKRALPPARSGQPTTDSEPTILVAEDEESLREFAQLVLRRSGFKVITAKNGEEAWQIIESRKFPIRLLFSDVIMPRMSGPDLAKKIQATMPELPVLFTSGYTRNVALENGIEDSKLEFLQKPYTADELIQKIRAMLATGQISPTL
ncbi:MAG: response regulator [Verrucomicrobiota bacterium]|nr:response regulator [Verrucomicrobiota bacterium]